MDKPQPTKIMGDPLDELGLTAAELRAFADFVEKVEGLNAVGDLTSNLVVEGTPYCVRVGYDSTGTFCLLSVECTS